MAQAQDFLLGADGDLIIDPQAHDFQCGWSDPQHLEHILEAYPGWYRESILTGVGIQDYKNSAGAGPELKRQAQIQLQADNYKVNQISISGELTLAFDAQRIN